MRTILTNLLQSAKHLKVIDDFFRKYSPEYAVQYGKLRSLPCYREVAKAAYDGMSGRQMILSDLLQYLLTGRAPYVVSDDQLSLSQFSQLLLRMVNLLLIQESELSTDPQKRRDIVATLTKKVPHFYSATPVRARTSQEDIIAEMLRCQGLILVKRPRLAYIAMDSLLPKSIGCALELVAYAWLLRSDIGYVIPLLQIQRIRMGDSELPPPDFLLLLPKGVIYGVEIGDAAGQFSLQQNKVWQMNAFAQNTTIPVVTGTVPHLYRCPTCRRWITFCDSAIERAATESTSEMPESLACVNCRRFRSASCTGIIYYGRLQSGGEQSRYHYECVRSNSYVSERVSREMRGEKGPREKQDLIQYVPRLVGLEDLLG